MAKIENASSTIPLPSPHDRAGIASSSLPVQPANAAVAHGESGGYQFDRVPPNSPPFNASSAVPVGSAVPLNTVQDIEANPAPPPTYFNGLSQEGESDLHKKFAVEHADTVQKVIAQAIGGTALRGQHAAAHAAVKLSMDLYPAESLPEEAQIFLRQSPEQTHFDGVGRFSPSGSTPMGKWGQSEPAVHGFAIKLKVDGGEQDLLMTNMPGFFKDAEEVMLFVRANIEKGQAAQKATEEAKAAAQAGGKPLTDPSVQQEIAQKAQSAQVGFLARSKIGPERTGYLLNRVKEHFSRPVNSLAAETYFSPMPIRIGDKTARFRVRPITNDLQTHAAPGVTVVPKTKLSDDLRARTAGPDGVTYEMGLQFYVDDQKTPINDLTEPWNENDAPVVWVGKVKIPGNGQGVLSGDAEKNVNLASFSPKHTVSHSADVSEIGRARIQIYDKSATTRGSCPYGFGS